MESKYYEQSIFRTVLQYKFNLGRSGVVRSEVNEKSKGRGKDGRALLLSLRIWQGI